eukprot:12810258-Heterocapsa_arctica.AAC.1
MMGPLKGDRTSSGSDVEGQLSEVSEELVHVLPEKSKALLMLRTALRDVDALPRTACCTRDARHAVSTWEPLTIGDGFIKG